jgi:hypothetical protein
LYFSSILEDEERSGINKEVVDRINAGEFNHLNFLEVDNVCDHGLAIKQALQNRPVPI